MIPLDVTSDIGGPITRTVEDAARVLAVLQGSDPSDGLTQGIPTPPDNYTQFLQPDGLKVRCPAHHVSALLFQGSRVQVPPPFWQFFVFLILLV
jgi:Asp-tRNA(Asn)/Glu-tRNA(Gln) amidotransferase A subunit family amidase